MEGSDEHPSPKLQTPDEKPQIPQEQLGLGFQSDPNIDPPPPPPPPPPPQPTDDKLMQIAAQEIQNLALQEAINEEEIQNLASKQALDQDLHHCHVALKHAVNEALLNHQSVNQAIDEEIASSKQGISEGVLDIHALKTTDAGDEEYVRAESENEAKKGSVLEESEVKKDEEIESKQAITESLDGKSLNQSIDKGLEGCAEMHDEENVRVESENEPQKLRVLEGIEDGVKEENDNEDGNWSIEVKGKDGIDGYNVKRSENVEESDNENEGGDNDNAYGEEGYNGSESMGGDSVSKDGKYRRYYYPLRPDAEDCPYYLRTGMCKFGSNCKFNHPLRRKNQAAKENVKQKEENSERPGQIECKYYLTSGGCKFGKACRYNHSRGKTAEAPILEFNFLGLPIRLGEKECPYYMRTGSCKYGSNCRFNHPDPTAVGGGDPPSGYGKNGSVSLQGASQTTMSSWSSPRTLNETAPFVPIMYPPTQGISSPNPEWNGYQAPAYPTSERSLPTPPAFALKNPATDTNFYSHHQQPMLTDEFPERPGQLDCSYFLKTGDCKYRSACKFHHPKNRMPKTPPFLLSDKGLPLRPDQNICTHYSRYGICKFGPACKFDHPVNYGNSASSVGPGPDQSLPFGNLAIADGARMAGSGNGSL